MKQNSKKLLDFIITASLIAAAYAGLTYLCAALNIAYGPVQFRVSEVLTLLPIFTPAAIPGVTIGCFFANIGSFNLLDMVFGTAATLIASILTYLFRNIKFKNLPLLSMFPPVLINAIIIGLEINFFFLPEGASLWGFVSSAFSVGLGELAVCYVLGIPFYLLVDKYKLFERKI